MIGWRSSGRSRRVSIQARSWSFVQSLWSANFCCSSRAAASRCPRNLSSRAIT
jgi:hypothetical protein